MTQTQGEKLAQEAINDPVAFYGTPDKVLADNRLSTDEKRRVLQSWELDQKRLITSEGENMPAPAGKSPPHKSSELLRTVQATLRQLPDA